MDTKNLFRADMNYKTGTPIVCMDSESDKDVYYHIKFGTNKDTHFISTTAELSIAAIKFASGGKKDKDEKRARIILIDFEKLKSMQKEKESTGEQYIYDFTDEEQIDKHLNYDFQIMHRVRADREVVINREIPSECCKEIPPIAVDILLALQTDLGYDVKKHPEKKQIQEVGKIISNNILDMVRQGNTKFLDNIISSVQFNELEEEFMSLYYTEMMTLENVAKTMFGDKKEREFLANAILSQIIKKVIKSRDFPEIALLNKQCSREEIMAAFNYPIELEDSYVSPLAWEKVNWKYAKHPDTNRMVRALIEEEKSKFSQGNKGKEMSSTATTEAENVRFFESIKISVGKKQDLRFSSGMSYRIENGKIISCVPKYKIYNRRRKKIYRGRISQRYNVR